jgi:hypothetical protein
LPRLPPIEFDNRVAVVVIATPCGVVISTLRSFCAQAIGRMTYFGELGRFDPL